MRFPPPVAGFERAVRSGLGVGGRVVILKSAMKERLLEAGVHDPDRMARGPLFAGWLEGGRTRHALLRADGDEWVLKAYRRGGFLGRLNSTRYWDSSRFFEELRVAAFAEGSGVPTAEVLALVLERAGMGSVRAWLVVRYLGNVRPLHEFFDDPAEGPVFHAAGQVVARMHAAGIDHPDLHLGNIVVSFEEGDPRAHIIDWDRARVRDHATWSPHANLARLWRSLEKGRGTRGIRFGRSVRSFVRGYFHGRPRALEQAREYFRKRAVILGARLWVLRAFVWRSRR